MLGATGDVKDQRSSHQISQWPTCIVHRAEAAAATLTTVLSHSSHQLGGKKRWATYELWLVDTECSRVLSYLDDFSSALTAGRMRRGTFVCC